MISYYVYNNMYSHFIQLWSILKILAETSPSTRRT